MLPLNDGRPPQSRNRLARDAFPFWRPPRPLSRRVPPLRAWRAPPQPAPRDPPWAPSFFLTDAPAASRRRRRRTCPGTSPPSSPRAWRRGLLRGGVGVANHVERRAASPGVKEPPSAAPVAVASQASREAVSSPSLFRWPRGGHVTLHPSPSDSNYERLEEDTPTPSRPGAYDPTSGPTAAPVAAAAASPRPSPPRTSSTYPRLPRRERGSPPRWRCRRARGVPVHAQRTRRPPGYPVVMRTCPTPSR